MQGKVVQAFRMRVDCSDLTMEMALIGLLRDAFIHGKQVKLGYRNRLGGKYISVAWVK